MDNLTTSILKPEEWEVWKALRIDMLQNNPELFPVSLESELTKPDQIYQQQVEQNTIFVTKHKNDPIACLGYFRSPLERYNHRINVWCLYLKPAYRQQGIGSEIASCVFEHVKNDVFQVYATCLATNEQTINLCYKFGFTKCAEFKKSVRLNDQFLDSYVLKLSFDDS